MMVMTLAIRLNQLENIDVASKRQTHSALEHKDWLLRCRSDGGWGVGLDPMPQMASQWT